MSSNTFLVLKYIMTQNASTPNCTQQQLPFSSHVTKQSAELNPFANHQAQKADASTIPLAKERSFQQLSTEPCITLSEVETKNRDRNNVHV